MAGLVSVVQPIFTSPSVRNNAAKQNRSQVLLAHKVAKPTLAARFALRGEGVRTPKAIKGRGRSFGVVAALAEAENPATLAAPKLSMPGLSRSQITHVMKFGGSSVRDAERMVEVAAIICAFPENAPAIVLSAMGKTTNNLLAAGEQALKTPAKDVKNLAPLKTIRQLHLDTIATLGVEDSVRHEIEELVEELGQLLSAISIMQELTPRMRANLVSYGERMSTRIFASFLRTQGVEARQFDAVDIGFACTDDNYENGEILPETYPVLKKSLTRAEGEKPFIPVITGFLAKGVKTGAVCTLGRGGSDLTATVIGAALKISEVQVWKDVDGVLSADPRRISNAIPVPFLTYEEATELAYFGAQVLHPHAMRPAMDSNGTLNVRVKNSYNILADGTLITKTRDVNENFALTSIVMKEDITLLDIVSTRMLGQYGFLATVFGVLNDHKLSVDMMATSEVSVSVTLDPVKFWARDLEEEELAALSNDLSKYATLVVKKGYTILSMIGKVQGSSQSLHRAFYALDKNKIDVVMVSKGASKVNVSLVVEGSDGENALKALHEEFFSGEPFCGYIANTPCPDNSADLAKK
eukprot:CAMPEP_0198199080 /NCGR_PEP_ID=MMETSP1445-20131203/2408_1 /TAXON_ID=36898 /ORGANISM="Pyramimonas sp., Strain CCMP2087" /LENGTH=581 /DNA_ID=CAMNT_0043868797 /DNA_START=76 /DNA_END=1821 /DNA_ORIENTATION=-